MIEAINSSTKHRFGGFLLSKHNEMQVEELGLKVLAHRLKQRHPVNRLRSTRFPFD
ncbi:MAG TPA: hypothetical protein HA348_00230 [Thermoplasmata archaeon]|nr:hypothetical protein [Thermoplasmata archaeon]